MKRQAFTMWIMAAAAGVAGISVGFWGWPFFWLAADFLVLGGAYYINAPGVFGKRRDGTLPVWSWFLFLPHFLLTHLVWHFAVRLLREPAWNVVSDELILGRRPLPGEMPDAISNYVDLTAEFEEPLTARTSSAYLNFPILDAGTPEVNSLRQVVASLKPGRTFVHCAQGRGRTGLFAVAILLTARRVASVEEALRVLQAARPGVHLNPEQRRCAEAMALALQQERSAT